MDAPFARTRQLVHYSCYQPGQAAIVLDDQELMALLAATAQGQEEAFARLYRHSAPNLFAVLVRILKRKDWAEEALQETFVRIWNHAQDYRPHRGRPMTWMQSIARYRALDMLRRLPLELLHEDLSGHTDAAAADSRADPIQHMDDELLRRCLEELQEQARTCIIMAYYEGYTHEQLSARLSAPLGTVKSWIRRGLGRLRECLET